jgi:hypothetical protein
LQIGSLHSVAEQADISKIVTCSWLSSSAGPYSYFLNITYLLVGLYFIAGLRFDIWNEGLLAVIPVVVFVFVIFFSPFRRWHRRHLEKRDYLGRDYDICFGCSALWLAFVQSGFEPFAREVSMRS